MPHRPTKRAKLEATREPFESSQEDYTQHVDDAPMEDASADDPLAAIAAFLAPGTFSFSKQAAPMPSRAVPNSTADERMEEHDEGEAANEASPPAAAAAAASSSAPGEVAPLQDLKPARFSRGHRQKDVPDDEEAIAIAKERQRKKNKRKDVPKSANGKHSELITIVDSVYVLTHPVFVACRISERSVSPTCPSTVYSHLPCPSSALLHENGCSRTIFPLLRKRSFGYIRRIGWMWMR